MSKTTSFDQLKVDVGILDAVKHQLNKSSLCLTYLDQLSVDTIHCSLDGLITVHNLYISCKTRTRS